jgi:hypothetical protein
VAADNVNKSIHVEALLLEGPDQTLLKSGCDSGREKGAHLASDANRNSISALLFDSVGTRWQKQREQHARTCGTQCRE